ncbi:YggS family pyridoxal phosphate-dependent enzyme [Algiphilus sp.]|jgi:pyridoxal phosphate enzyme (YggS family)|uniref:YggS family pyridoxal phosphate-dependent enzyme n=1 Tax=Algiphilus sp. TaxID=1872431 RepID=UPI002A612B56|nr:YggS family pyridoxal phosphate-dependent enzyme [Pseudomonadota bacterium]
MTDHTSAIPERLQALHERIESARLRAGTPQPVTLIAVSKRQPLEAVRAAVAAGQRVFGENYVQEGVEKRAQIADPELCWHHIGPIQSNKCRDIASAFDWAQGVDRSRIIQRLGAARQAQSTPLSVCIQVNISGEASKSGAAPEAVEGLCTAVLDQPGLQLRGLMAIPAPRAAGGDPERDFDALRALYEGLRDRGFPLDTLSMGMSDDFEAAIAAGATMVRVGSALFGPRPQG